MKQLVLNKSKYAHLNATEMKQSLSKEYSVFSWQDTARATYSKHSHAHDEVIVVYQGAIKFTINSKDYLLEVGDELVLPAGTVHSAIVLESGCHYLICS